MQVLWRGLFCWSSTYEVLNIQIAVTDKSKNSSTLKMLWQIFRLLIWALHCLFCSLSNKLYVVIFYIPLVLITSTCSRQRTITMLLNNKSVIIQINKTRGNISSFWFIHRRPGFSALVDFTYHHCVTGKETAIANPATNV